MSYLLDVYCKFCFYILETCLSLGLKPAGIMKVLNTFIVDNNLPEELLLSESTTRRAVQEVFAKNREIHLEKTKRLPVIAYDGRQDQSVQSNGKIVAEEHITICDNSIYIDHGTIIKEKIAKVIGAMIDPEAIIGKKSAINHVKVIARVIVKHESVDILLYLQSDGTVVNTGYKGMFLYCIYFKTIYAF